MKMSLAQALRKKAEIVNEIATLQSRITEAVSFREGCDVYSREDFVKMQEDLLAARAKLIRFKVAIDKGNHTDFNGETVFGLITRRGEDKSALEFLCHLRNSVASSFNGDRFGGFDKDAPKMVCRMTVKEIDVTIDTLKKRLRETDDNISNINGKLDIEVDI